MQVLNCFVPNNRWGMCALAAAAAMALTTVAVQQASAASAPTASGTGAETASGALNTYALTLTDSASSPSPIGSVWEAWVPGKFYMSSSPSSITSPAGWTSNLTSGGGGFGIQWIASSAASDVPVGGSLSGFGFQTPDSPASIFGNSSVVAGVPTLTSVAHDAGLFSDSGTTFVFTQSAVPEPVSLALLTPAALLLRRRSRRIV